MTRAGVRCMLMRGGTSKGAYFLAEDLPADPSERDELLLSIMGSPDSRQIDGIGGAHPLTSKVAVIDLDADGGVGYLFLQVAVDEAIVTDRQNCGNLLAGVGPFAIERGLVEAVDGETAVPIHLRNSGGTAVARVRTPGAVVDYAGDTSIAGVPGTAAPVLLDFADTAGSATGALLPTGSPSDTIEGVEVTCIDNGMPVVVVRAGQLGLDGDESPEQLEADVSLRERVQRIRVEAGRLMGLGDVTSLSIPKVSIVSSARAGGQIATRTFIPHRVHTSIGVFGAASVAAACAIPGAVGSDLATPPEGGVRFSVEHPTGALEVEVQLEPSGREVRRTGVVRTARALFDGTVFAR